MKTPGPHSNDDSSDATSSDDTSISKGRKISHPFASVKKIVSKSSDESDDNAGDLSQLRLTPSIFGKKGHSKIEPNKKKPIKNVGLQNQPATTKDTPTKASKKRKKRPSRESEVESAQNEDTVKRSHGCPSENESTKDTPTKASKKRKKRSSRESEVESAQNEDTVKRSHGYPLENESEVGPKSSKFQKRLAREAGTPQKEGSVARRYEHTSGDESEISHKSSRSQKKHMMKTTQDEPSTSRGILKSPSPRKRQDSVTFSALESPSGRGHASRNITKAASLVSANDSTQDSSDLEQMVPGNQSAFAEMNASRQENNSFYQTPDFKNRKQQSGGSESVHSHMRKDASKKSKKQLLTDELEDCERPGGSGTINKTKQRSSSTEDDERIGAGAPTVQNCKSPQKKRKTKQETSEEKADSSSGTVKEGSLKRKAEQVKNHNSKNNTKTNKVSSETGNNGKAKPRAAPSNVSNSRTRKPSTDNAQHLLYENHQLQQRPSSSKHPNEEPKNQEEGNAETNFEPVIDWDAFLDVEDVNGKELFLLRYPESIECEELQGLCAPTDGVSQFLTERGKRITTISTTGTGIVSDVKINLPNRKKIVPNNLAFTGEIWIHEET